MSSESKQMAADFLKSEASVRPHPSHVLLDHLAGCPCHARGDICPVCEGGLAICAVCNKAENELNGLCMPAWRPIETAPKEGVIILQHESGNRLAMWLDRKSMWVSPDGAEGYDNPTGWRPYLYGR